MQKGRSRNLLMYQNQPLSGLSPLYLINTNKDLLAKDLTDLQLNNATPQRHDCRSSARGPPVSTKRHNRHGTVEGLSLWFRSSGLGRALGPLEHLATRRTSPRCDLGVPLGHAPEPRRLPHDAGEPQLAKDHGGFTQLHLDAHLNFERHTSQDDLASLQTLEAV